jgi:hypothetical protein
MSSTHQHPVHPYSLPPPPPPPMQSEVKLPSLKDLNFQYRSPPSAQDPPLSSSAASTSSDHGSQTYSSRREWSRAASSATSVNPSVSHAQQSPQFSPHEQKAASYSGYTPDSSHYNAPVPHQNHQQTTNQNARDESHHPTKRPRSSSNTISTPPANSPHVSDEHHSFGLFPENRSRLPILLCTPRIHPHSPLFIMLNIILCLLLLMHKP